MTGRDCVGVHDDAELLDDGLCNVVLDFENTLGGQGAIVGFRPEVLVGIGIDELSRDAHGFACLADGTLEHMAHLHLLGYERDTKRFLALEAPRCRARRDFETLDAHQHV